MTTRIGWPKAVALGFALTFLATAALPLASAQTQLNVKSVGEIFVDAHGKASGENVQASILEANGVLEAVVSRALKTEVFRSVAIDGFSQAAKIQGVGSSAITLKGSNAIVSMYDNSNSEFRIQATSPTTVHYTLPAKVYTREEGAHTMQLYGDDGAYLGALVLVGANGPAASSDALAARDGRVDAQLGAGSQVVWESRPVYVDSQAFNDAVLASLAAGWLSSKVVTEFEGSVQHSSKVDYFPAVESDAKSTADYSIESDVKSSSSSATMVAYDLAYESLPARSSSDVQMYADGQLAARASSAAEVQQYAASGLASYYAVTENGRSQILASTPDFKSTSEHHLTFTAGADASTEAQGRSDSRASSGSRAAGDYELHANGKLTGLFTTAVLGDGKMAVHDFTSLVSRTEIFQAVTLDGGAQATGTSKADHQVTLTGPHADVQLIDDAFATMIIDAREKSDAALALGDGVKATAQGAHVMKLAGPNGFVGVLILASADAESKSSLAAPQPGQVQSHLEPGSRLIFRSEAQSSAHVSESAIAEAIAAGQIGAQFIAGLQGNSVSTSQVSYQKSVDANVVSSARGSYKVDYVTRAPQAQTFVFDSRGTALAAQKSSDVKVLVDGQAATAVSTPQAVFSATGGAKYFVDTTAQGETRVLVNTASLPSHKSNVEIQSTLDSQARASAKQDAFGTFKQFYDGTAVGSFVSLKSDAQAGVVNDFSMLSTGQTIFTSIQAGKSAFLSSGAPEAPQIVLENREAKMEFTDTTSGYMRVVAKKATETNFHLAPDVRAEQRSNAVIELATASGQDIGSLVITDIEGKAAESSSFSTPDTSAVHTNLEQGAQVIFRTHVGIEAELSGAQRAMIDHAIAAGRVAGQVLVQSQRALSSAQASSVSASASAHAQAQSNLESTSQSAFDGASSAVTAAEEAGTFTTAVTASYYNDVQMVTAATQGRVDVTVSSAVSAGKTIIVSLDPATIPTLSTGDADILVDGHLATQASSYADVLNPTDDAGAAEYFVLAGEAGTQVLVSLPHFSTHTVTLKEHEASAPPLFMYATIFLAALVAVETVVIVRRRNA